MALRLRRGTDAERQLITPLEGELIYATDTKSLYVGDGSTLGGILIAASGEVSNTVAGLLDTDIAGLQDGDVLVYNSLTNEWNNRQSALELDDLTDLSVTNSLNFDIISYDGLNWKNIRIESLADKINTLTTLTDLEGVGITDPKNFHILYYDGNIWANTPATSLTDAILSQEQTHTLTIAGNDSTILVDPVTNIHRGDFYGSLYDGLGNLMIDEFTKAAMVDVRDPTDTYTVLDNFTGDLRRGENGQIIIQGGATPTFIGSVDGPIRGTVVGPDLNIILNHDTGTLYGDVIGSLFGDDSTVVFDGVSGKFNLNDTINGSIKTRVVDDFPRIVMVRESAGDIAADDLAYGSIQWRRDDVNGEVTNALISGGNEALLIAQSNDGVLGPDKFVVLDEGNMSIGGFVPTAKLDVRGDIKAESSITPGVYADAATRDAAITAPAEGMLVFLQDTQKFVGYVSDTGLAGGGVSNTTPGWVDLY